MLDGILTNSEGEKFELSIENAVNPETFKNEIVEGMQPSHELQNGAIPVAINRQSPYYQKLNMQLQVGDYLPYIIDTGYGQKRSGVSCKRICRKQRYWACYLYKW